MTSDTPIRPRVTAESELISKVNLSAEPLERGHPALLLSYHCLGTCRVHDAYTGIIIRYHE